MEITKVNVTSSLKGIQTKYRTAVDSGRVGMEELFFFDLKKLNRFGEVL
jgi:hypothetical protein